MIHGQCGSPSTVQEGLQPGLSTLATHPRRPSCWLLLLPRLDRRLGRSVQVVELHAHDLAGAALVVGHGEREGPVVVPARLVVRAPSPTHAWPECQPALVPC